MAGANGFAEKMRKVYNPIGFTKGYNFVFWFISIGYLMGFTLSRLQYFSYNGIFCKTGAAPGECFYYLQNPYKIGMMLHLFTILPATFLVCFQFVPIIRHKVILFHRINGYIVIILSLIASAGALIVTQHAFGGDLATRTFTGALVISTTLSYLFAWLNIRRLQIDQHRAWMMRAWAYFGTIVTLRIIQILAALIISRIGGFYVTRPCAQLSAILGGEEVTLELYPECLPFFQGANPGLHVVVASNFNSKNPAEIAAALGINFGSAGWAALWLHALYLTPAETDRLRQVSYERQVNRGWKNAGSSGLVAQRFGDASPYLPRKKVGMGQEDGMVDVQGQDLALTQARSQGL